MFAGLAKLLSFFLVSARLSFFFPALSDWKEITHIYVRSQGRAELSKFQNTRYSADESGRVPLV